MFIGKRPGVLILFQAVTGNLALLVIVGSLFIAPFTSDFINYLTIYVVESVAIIFLGLPAIVSSLNPFADKAALKFEKIGGWAVLAIAGLNIVAVTPNPMLKMGIFITGLVAILWLFFEKIVEGNPEVKAYLANL